jgi:hypothetical protein
MATAATAATPPHIYKHIVIVHGIGDQVPNETSISFMNNFLRALPERGTELDVDNLIESVDPPDRVDGAAPARFTPAFVKYSCARGNFVIGFSEVYWQDITNSYLKHGAPPIPIFVWAHSINTRLLRHGRSFHVAREAIDNLERLLGLTRLLAMAYKKSDVLYRVLNRFLGDVQMYAESDDIRGRINRRFAHVAAQVSKLEAGLKEPFNLQGSPEIYVVAHSEGTVISYSTLVEAAEGKAAWFGQVCGLVTLGSPLDKHYSIWHNRFRTDAYSGGPRERLIPWFNYWDVSDPVGYGLSRLQVRENAAQPTDAEELFDVRYDQPFARYLVPGLAHVEYWTDRDLHSHIIRHVLDLGPAPPDTVEPVPDRWFGKGHIQDIGDRVSYTVGRLLTIASGIFFFAHLAAPLPATWKPTWFQRAPFVSSVLMPVPLAVCLLLWQGYGSARGGKATAWLWSRRIVWLAWLAVAVLFGLSVSREFPATPPPAIKDVVGYLTGLGMTAAAWALHTTVHKGLVQMWRYTKGAGSCWVQRPRAAAAHGGD